MDTPDFNIDDVGGDSLTAKLGSQVLRLEEFLREVYDNKFRALTVAVVVEGVVYDDDDEPTSAINPIHYACSDNRRWVQEALLAEARELATELNEGRDRQVKKALGVEDDE